MISKLKFLMIAGLFVTCIGSGALAHAEPAAGCAMLTPSQIEKVFGQPFGPPSESKAPPAYAKQSWGWNCRYRAQKRGRVREVTFIVYEDGSQAEAKQTFDKLSAWYSPKSKPAIGDSAYIDSHSAIHIVKGKVRFYVSLDPADEKGATNLAAAIAAHI